MISLALPAWRDSVPKTFNNLQTNQQADFSTVVALRSIAGRVVTANNTGVPNVNISLSDGIAVASGGLRLNAATDGSGNYQFTNLPSDRTYTLLPSGNFFFSPASATLSIPVTNGIANFTATSAHVIQGTVRRVSSGVGISNATVRFESTKGALIASAASAANGTYTSPLIGDGSNYVIRVSKPNYTFSPGKRNVDGLANNVSGVDFDGTEQFFTISGIVTNADGFRVPNVRFNLSGGAMGQVDSASGFFSFPNLTGGLNYTVTPSKPGWTFIPATLTLNNLTTNRSTGFKRHHSSR